MPNLQQNDRLHVLKSRVILPRFSCFSCGFFLFCLFCSCCLFRVGEAFRVFFGWGLSITFVIFPVQTGTATSSPYIKTPSPNIINVMLWMKRNAYADSTIKATTKRLKHLQKHCNLNQPEEVQAFNSVKRRAR